jgi:hypothetical protein
MAQRSVFYQTCPVCGRSLRMPVEVFGRNVTCVHCGGEFRSEQLPADNEPAGSEPGECAGRRAAQFCGRVLVDCGRSVEPTDAQ